jgi:hypothetical protein
MLEIGPYGDGYSDCGRGYNPFACVPSPLAFAPVAGPDGVSLNRFGWLDPDTGEVSNIYEAGALLGLILPQPYRYARNGWNLAYWSAGALILRSGQMVTLAAQGDFWVRFAGGAMPGQQVWADINDGSAGAGAIPMWTADSNTVTADSYYTADGAMGVYTPWTVMTYAPPGAPALISSWAKPF